MDDAGEHAAPTARVPPHEADDLPVDSREPEAGPGREGAPSDSLKQGLSVSETTSGPAGNIATSVSVLDKASCLACTSNRKGHSHTCGKGRRSFKRGVDINSQGGGRSMRRRLQSADVPALGLTSSLDAAQTHENSRETARTSRSTTQLTAEATEHGDERAVVPLSTSVPDH